MIKGLTEFELYKVVRPVIGGCDLDSYYFPVIHKPAHNSIDWENIRPINYQSLSPRHDNSEVLALMFRYDKNLLALWNNPFKWIPLFQCCMAVSTPDFSAYASMNPNEIRHNIFMSRWLGCTWQNYGCTVLPTIGWAEEDTFDLCFGGIEEGCPVVISTVGCQDHRNVFLKGFNEMKKRIKPPIIIVYGDMIEGMCGTFIHFAYEDSFAKPEIQLRISRVSQIFTIEEVA